MKNSAEILLRATEPQKNKERRIKTSFSVSPTNYEKLRKLCKERGITPSQILDLMIADLVEEFYGRAK